jgi:deazaflavin-dependent oxidoreductase (nitroreductase family)
MMNSTRARHGWLWLLKNTLNRGTSRLAHSGHGPFSLIRHVGRKTGRVYETPLILARLGDDFVAELTYGPDVAWYRNVVAAGQCEVIFHGADYRIDRIEPLDTATGLAAFGYPAELVLRLMRRRHFRLLHQVSSAVTADGSPA